MHRAHQSAFGANVIAQRLSGTEPGGRSSIAGKYSTSGAENRSRDRQAVGIGVATGAALAIDTLIGEPRSLGSRLLTLATFAAVGAVEGTALAGFQWRVLRTRLPRLRAAEWIGVPSGAPGEPGLMIVLLMAAIAGAGAGVCFGVAQWFVLRAARNAA